MLKIVSAEFIKGAINGKQFPQIGVPEFAFFGRSNAGKSSLINMLLNRKNLVKTGSKPGMTREINFFMVNGPARLELPGVGRRPDGQSDLQEPAAVLDGRQRDPEDAGDLDVVGTAHHHAAQIVLRGEQGGGELVGVDLGRCSGARGAALVDVPLVGGQGGGPVHEVPELVGAGEAHPGRGLVLVQVDVRAVVRADDHAPRVVAELAGEDGQPHAAGDLDRVYGQPPVGPEPFEHVGGVLPRLLPQFYSGGRFVNHSVLLPASPPSIADTTATFFYS